jgi:hypothetical protein
VIRCFFVELQWSSGSAHVTDAFAISFLYFFFPCTFRRPVSHYGIGELFHSSPA